ncbi:hypothetical protein DPMN_087130 [Dreissena polymorpha]|nr:hypothetical protein DPMN_087130 [Dreissena polymorpha]
MMNIRICFLVAISVRVISGTGCEDGWIPYAGNCYHFSHDMESWIEAEGMCLHLGGHLVEINSRSENTFLQGWVDMLNTHFWAGATDLNVRGDWVWVTSKTHLSNTFSLWAPGEPNNLNGWEEHCLMLWTHVGWNDMKCSEHLNYICEAYG